VSSWSPWDEVAVDVGRLCIVARRLHVALGSAALVVPTPGIAVLFDEWSLNLAEHAASLWEHLPLRAGFDRGSVLDSGAYDEVLCDLESTDPSIDELYLFVGIVTIVIPALRRDVTAIHQRTSDVAERSLRRTLSFLEIDLEVAWLQGDERLSTLADDGGLKDQMNSARAEIPVVALG
jgi:hypothetical protein